MSLKEQVVQQVRHLPDAELKHVANYLAFLKYHALRKRMPMQIADFSTLAALYAEFADEDRALAEEGMAEYARSLAAEDTK